MIINIKINLIKLFAFFLVINFISCSSTIEETREESVSGEDETYIFDDIPEGEETEQEEIPETEAEYYSVQIGAFTTRQRADTFMQESEAKLGRKLRLSFSGDVNLFVVQLNEKFSTRDEAEKVRNLIRENDEFKDAWVVAPAK